MHIFIVTEMSENTLDNVLFILKHLYKDISDEPDTQNDFMDNEINQSGDLKGWYNGEDVAEEELPLTFSNTKFE